LSKKFIYEFLIIPILNSLLHKTHLPPKNDFEFILSKNFSGDKFKLSPQDRHLSPQETHKSLEINNLPLRKKRITYVKKKNVIKVIAEKYKIPIIFKFLNFKYKKKYQ